MEKRASGWPTWMCTSSAAVTGENAHKDIPMSTETLAFIVSLLLTFTKAWSFMSPDWRVNAVGRSFEALVETARILLARAAFEQPSHYRPPRCPNPVFQQLALGSRHSFPAFRLNSIAVKREAANQRGL
jgi:hypothetical protein